MTMGEETPANSLVFSVMLRPILAKLERQNGETARILRSGLLVADSSCPGIAHDLVMGIMRRADPNLDINESMLRFQGVASDWDVMEFHSTRSENAFQELNRKSASLKRILSRIPDEITDRKTFLETIKEIASAIKKLLDAVNEVTGFIPGLAGRQALDQRKREFVKYSKRFSNTLKEYFKEGQANAVFVSALYLIFQTNAIMSTVENI